MRQKINPAQGQFGEQDIDRILMNIQRFAGGASPDAKGTLKNLISLTKGVHYVPVWELYNFLSNRYYIIV